MAKILKKANQPSLSKPLKGPTLMQERVMDAALGKLGKPKSKAEILRQAGYAPSVVDNPKIVFGSKTIKAKLDPIVQTMIEHRKQVLALMKTRVTKANYASLSISARNLNHDIALLSGNPTEREEYKSSPEDRAMMQEIIEMNK